MITPNMLILKYKNDQDFMEFVWLFAVPVRRTKAETRELLKSCGNNIFEADLSDDIAWALVKLMDNASKWNGGTFGKKKGSGVHKFTVCGKGGGFGWNDTGIELYKILRGCFKAIKAAHWEKSWQEYWACAQPRLGKDTPAKAGGRAGGGDDGACEEECLPMESSDLVYAEV